MHNRLKKLRKDILKISQKEFGEKIGKEQTSIANYESGKRNIPKRTIKDICREYNVNEEWLKMGNEPIFQENLNLYEIEKFKKKINTLADKVNPSTIKILHTIADMSEEEWKAIEDFINKIKK